MTNPESASSSLKVRTTHAYTAHSRFSYLLAMSLDPRKLMSELRGDPVETANHGTPEQSKSGNPRMIIMIAVLIGLGAYLYWDSQPPATRVITTPGGKTIEVLESLSQEEIDAIIKREDG